MALLILGSVHGAYCDSSPSQNRAMCNEVVSAWNSANNSADLSGLSGLYDSEVLFYGTPLKKGACLESKRKFFKKHTDFSQSVDHIEAEEGALPGQTKCLFAKRVSMAGEAKNYPSYLVLDQGKIITEGDDVTDANLAKRAGKRPERPKDSISGDFNGDGTLDYAWVEAPSINEEGTDCVGECVCTIRFSDARIPTISLPQCIGGTPDDLGDLNRSGGHEIGLSPNWFTSCWSGYHVWTLLKDKWVEAVKPISTHCDQFERGIKPIETDTRNGYVIVRSSELKNDDIVVVERSVPIKR